MKSIFKYILLSLIAVGLGYAGGSLACRQQYKDVQEPFYTGEYDQGLLDTLSPVMVIDGGYKFDFGEIQPGEHTHEFIIENRGTANLKVSVEKKSDNIKTDFGADQQLIVPGASLPMEITLTVADDDSKAGFVQLETNDDKLGSVRLDVTGRKK